MVDVIVDLIDEQVFICFVWYLLTSWHFNVLGPASLRKGRRGKDKVWGETDSSSLGKGGFSSNSNILRIIVLLQVEARLAAKEGVWLVGDSLTWADLYLFHYLTSWAAAIPDLLKPLPNCQKLIEGIKEIPQLKDWIDMRPKTVMWLNIVFDFTKKDIYLGFLLTFVWVQYEFGKALGWSISLFNDFVQEWYMIISK